MLVSTFQLSFKKAIVEDDDEDDGEFLTLRDHSSSEKVSVVKTVIFLRGLVLEAPIQMSLSSILRCITTLTKSIKTIK